jgi:integrase
MQRGWLTRAERKKGDVWLHHFYFTRDMDGKRVETCRTVGLVSKYPREAEVWAEVERTSQGSIEGNPGRMSVNQLAASYKKVEMPNKAQSTQELHRHILDNYILVRWGKHYVDEVRVLEIKNWFTAIAKENKLTRQTIRKIKQVFGRLYAFGSENEMTPMNLNPVKACNIKGIGCKGKSKAFVVPPTIAWKIAMALPIQYRTLVLLAAGTGMRVSELLGLRWADIDFHSRTIHLNRTWLYGQTGEGKSDESRKPVGMGNRVAEFLLEWRRQTVYAGATDWVFGSKKLKGARPISGSQFVKDYIRPRFVEHGLIAADYTGRAGLHAFRHSLATVLITEEGQDPKTVQEILRHATSDITMDIYTHAPDAVKRAALERFESRMVQ